MTLKDSQSRVDAWITQFEEGYFHPLTNLARLAEEVGELAREVNHRFGQKTKKKDEPEGDMAMEMADILFVLICMANREGIDLQDAAFDRMMAKVEGGTRIRWTRKEAEGAQVVGVGQLCARYRQSSAYSHSLGALSSSASSTLIALQPVERRSRPPPPPR